MNNFAYCNRVSQQNARKTPAANFPRMAVFRMACLALVAAGGCCAPAKANLVIDPVWANSISSDPNAATIEGTIDTAISNFETDISNPVTVYINFTEATSGLGGSNTTAYVVPYSNYLNGLENNQILSLNDSTALNSLGLTAPYTAPNPTTNPVTAARASRLPGPCCARWDLALLLARPHRRHPLTAPSISIPTSCTIRSERHPLENIHLKRLCPMK